MLRFLLGDDGNQEEVLQEEEGDQGLMMQDIAFGLQSPA